MVYKKHNVGTRVQALALVEYGIPVDKVTAWTGLSRSTIYELKAKAKERGYNPQIDKTLKIEYVVDAPRSGRPRKVTEAKELNASTAVGRDTLGGNRDAEEREDVRASVQAETIGQKQQEEIRQERREERLNENVCQRGIAPQEASLSITNQYPASF